MVIIISGVSGVGKTTIGVSLAENLGWKFYDADDYHSKANIERMRAGIPLTDADRNEWLASLRNLIIKSLTANENAVLACSALKKSYREFLLIDENVKIVLLNADFSTIENRMKRRAGHFMSPALLKSQFETLEIPDDESITVLDAKLPTKHLLQVLIDLARLA